MSARFTSATNDAPSSSERPKVKPAASVEHANRLFPLVVKHSIGTPDFFAKPTPARRSAGTDRKYSDHRFSGEHQPRKRAAAHKRRVNVRGRDLGFVTEAQDRVRSEVPIRPGYVVLWGRSVRNLSAASQRLAVAVPVALGLIFILWYMAFGELKATLLIYLNLPFAPAAWFRSPCGECPFRSALRSGSLRCSESRS